MIVGMIFIAALVNIAFNVLMSNADFLANNAYSQGLAYALRIIYHACLFDIFFSFTLYAVVISNMEKKQARLIAIVSSAIFFIIVAIDIVLSLTGNGFFINKETGLVDGGSNVFLIGYVLYYVFLAVLLLRIRKLIYKRLIIGFYGIMILSLVIRFIQIILGQSSLTTMTFVFSALAMLYYVHINPYDTGTGMLDIKSMADMIKNLNAKKKSFIFSSLLLPEFVGEGKSLPEYVNTQTRRFSFEYFRNGVLFKVGNGQIVMIAAKRGKRDYEKWLQTIFTAFLEQYDHYKHPYKIVYGELSPNSVSEKDFTGLIGEVNDSIPENTIYRIEEKDIIHYNGTMYVAEQLEDIYRKCDLNDPRVIAVYQPVYNILTKRFDTAEVLMRLNLEKSGVVSPVVFIPIAEECGYIHALTKIVLNKACRTIRKLTEEGCAFERISINVSALELKDEKFCDDVNRILNDNGVSKDKIAIELTESQNEKDFFVMKDRIKKLHEEGIRFYLDDFGTGYSNLERILELPFDIIKFDRSLVNAIRQDEKSEYLVKKLANVFSDFKYCVLFEGIEDEGDEKRCLEMSATYLQGFKYSRPVSEKDISAFFINK